MLAARIIAGTLLKEGVQGAQVVEGWIQFQDEDGSEPEDMRFAHTWVETDDQILDPTLEQFKDYLDYYDFRREVLESVPAAEYLADERLNTETPAIFFQDGVVPAEVQQYLPKAKPKRFASLGM